MLIDFTECIGCQQCERGCREQNNLPENPDESDLSWKNFTVVLQHEESGQFYRKMCMHCNTPTCASVCPVAALEKTENGPVIYHPDKCMGCRYCMMACPFSVPRYQWNKPIPIITKCIFCNSRVEEGGETACSWICPTGATRMGTRSHLLEIARDRLARKPDRYYQHIYGENEVGGTSVMMISGVPFEELGFPVGLGQEALPNLSWKVLRLVPSIVVTGGLMLGGVSWIINRRIQLEDEKAETGSTVAADKKDDNTVDGEES